MLKKMLNGGLNGSVQKNQVQMQVYRHEVVVAPDLSRETRADSSPDLSIIERSPSPPILVSDASIEDLRKEFEKCTCFTGPLSKDTSSSCTNLRTSKACPVSHGSHSPCPPTFAGQCSPRTSPGPPDSQTGSGQPSPRTCLSPQTRRTCLKSSGSSPKTKCVKIEVPERKDNCQECFEELYFNAGVQRSDASIGGRCNDEENGHPEKTTNESPINTQEGKKELIDCSCSSSSLRIEPRKIYPCVERINKEDANHPHIKIAKMAPCIVKTIKKEVPKCSCISSCSAKKASDDSNCMDRTKKDDENDSCAEIKDSGGACSLGDSATGSCDANTRASYYHSKLLSTLQILQNKEETIRVQTESLSMAEGRISALTERATEMKRELEQKTKEVQALRKTLECCRVEKIDACIAVEPEMENQSDIVNTLQDNLSVIEDLYRECFYETAKQESLIDMLRKSYLDVRFMDKQKADQIGRLQTVINTQKWSLDRCQDLAVEVDNLKMEISNFLSSSTSTNNDSGMWERNEELYTSAPGVQEELQDVMEQLLRLRELLTVGSSWCMEEENKRLKLENEALEKKIEEICGRKCELKRDLTIKENLEKHLREQLALKEEQLSSLKKQLASVIADSTKNSIACEQLTKSLQQLQASLDDKSEELTKMQQQCQLHQDTISQLRQDLKKAEHLCKENCKIRSEVGYLTSQVTQWREQLEESESRVRKLDAKLRQAHACYREKENSVSELQSQLEAAHARGAELCADARRALAAVRHWARRMRDRHREHEKMIREKDSLIVALHRRLPDHRCSTQSGTIDESPCPKCPSAIRQPSCSKLESRRSQYFNQHSSAIASCSRPPCTKPPCGDERCDMPPWLCDASVQQPLRCDACVDPKAPFCQHGQRGSTSTTLSGPADELFQRVEKLSRALTEGYRRWTRPDPR